MRYIFMEKYCIFHISFFLVLRYFFWVCRIHTNYRACYRLYHFRNALGKHTFHLYFSEVYYLLLYLNDYVSFHILFRCTPKSIYDFTFSAFNCFCGLSDKTVGSSNIIFASITIAPLPTSNAFIGFISIPFMFGKSVTN
jgi:hypothetical protein